jgi:isoquinoline 1-oxidoreductase
VGGALFEAVDFADGKLLNAGLSDYRVPRFSDVPKIEILIMDRKDLPSSGAGELRLSVLHRLSVTGDIGLPTGVALTVLPMLPTGKNEV